MKTRLALATAALLLAGGALAAPSTTHGGHPSITINSVSPGPTPFIAFLDATLSPPGALRNARFTIAPKPFSVTRPISALQSATWLRDRASYNPTTGHLSLPVFGLYADYDNTVTLDIDFTQGPSASMNVSIATGPWTDPLGGAYANPGVLVPRTTSTALSYDFMMLKGFQAAISPIVMDTDGQVRWVGNGYASIPAFFDGTGFYVSAGSAVAREELDGTSRIVRDYASVGVTFTGHHNYDAGRDGGILVEVNETNAIESTILEIAPSGQILHTWRVADILRNLMTAGGDDPSAFIRAPDDWFHNNASTYDRSEDALVVSGREDFVIALDYDSGAVKWILGDPTKKWHEYPTLRAYELQLLDGTEPPIGQHALSVTSDGDLMLFDNGRASLNQNPIGADRSFSVPRKFKINPRKMTAVETWRYSPSPSLYSPYCSSTYEDARDNYLFDFTLAGDLIGMDADGNVAFHYLLSTGFGCGVSWNARPIHLENVELK